MKKLRSSITGSIFDIVASTEMIDDPPDPDEDDEDEDADDADSDDSHGSLMSDEGSDDLLNSVCKPLKPKAKAKTHAAPAATTPRSRGSTSRVAGLGSSSSSKRHGGGAASSGTRKVARVSGPQALTARAPGLGSAAQAPSAEDAAMAHAPPEAAESLDGEIYLQRNGAAPLLAERERICQALRDDEALQNPLVDDKTFQTALKAINTDVGKLKTSYIQLFWKLKKRVGSPADAVEKLNNDKEAICVVSSLLNAFLVKDPEKNLDVEK
eukprot:15470248-Alexandrium_andersonii.AAC.1